MITGRRKRATRACIAAVVLWGFAGAARAQSGPAAAGTQSDAATKAGGDATPAAASSVRYYSKEQVEASFEQSGGGDTLYDGENGTRNYKIATSVRKKPGVVEVHMNLTDVCYILKGSATLLYGGKITDLIDSHFPDGRPYPKDELRGHNIVGGETRHLSAGDVVIIPNGVPHQFSQVDPPFWYYVVKVHNP
jgi:mannose-6-phosphate isomerase-like protein (cupin superfamily)